MIELSIKDANTALKEKKFTSVELTQAYLDRIAATDDKLNAYITVTPEVALEQAKAADVKGDFSSALAGIPMNLKDVVCTDGIKTTAASK
ncbi:MAG: amidase family protein, partial [Candidatus Peregrinibacteria bacterium]|nr:amidase family protein [Candidatus Peregrinibacteria bacterium]